MKIRVRRDSAQEPEYRRALLRLLALTAVAWSALPAVVAPASANIPPARFSAYGGVRPRSAPVRHIRPALAPRATTRSWYFAPLYPNTSDLGGRVTIDQLFAVLNATSGAAPVTFTFYRRHGAPVVRHVSVPAGRVLLEDARPSAGPDPLIAAVVSSPRNLGVERITRRLPSHGNALSGAITPDVQAPSRQWFFPGANLGKAPHTYLTLFNPSRAKAQGTLHLAGAGKARPTVLRLAGLAQATVAEATLFAHANVGATRGVLLSSSRPIVAAQTLFSGAGSGPLQQGLAAAPGTSAASRQWYISGFATPFTNRATALLLAPGRAARVTITLRDAGGHGVSTRHLRIGAGGAATSELALPTGKRLALPLVAVIRADQPIIAAMAQEHAGSEWLLAAQAGALSSAQAPYLNKAGAPGVAALLDLYNPGRHTISLTLRAYDKSGRQTTARLSVGAGRGVRFDIARLKLRGVLGATLAAQGGGFVAAVQGYATSGSAYLSAPVLAWTPPSAPHRPKATPTPGHGPAPTPTPSGMQNPPPPGTSVPPAATATPPAAAPTATGLPPTSAPTSTHAPPVPTNTPTNAGHSSTPTATPPTATPTATAAMPTNTPTSSATVLPPDPASVAPPVDKSVATTLFTATDFLYTGNNPIQTGVVSGTIQITRTAILRGEVQDGSGNPLPGVTISILNHPEYGQTLSRADGMFDMAVNGGGLLTVSYDKTGYLSAQRPVQVPWQDFVPVPTVAMLQVDPNVTAIDLTSSAPLQIARGSAISDTSGQRQATLFFFPGTQATMTMPDGSTQPLTPTIHVRITEYTVGSNGPNAMPGPLPSSSGYTYAANYSVDEAIAAGAAGVSFSRPVISYLDNFLHFTVGQDVPVGYFDQTAGRWVAAQDGRVIGILSVTNGLADLDLGAGVPAAATALAALGISDAERAELAALYQPGQSLWRVPITQFAPAAHALQPRGRLGPHADRPHNAPQPQDGQPWDFNWGIAPPPGSTPPNQPQPQPQKPVKNPCDPPGLQCQNQVATNDIGINGTSFSLHYSSDRVPGHTAGNSLTIPLIGASVPASLTRIDLEIDIAGRQFLQSFPSSPNQSYTFTWDGKDAYGQTLQGPQTVSVRIGYVYPGVYVQPSQNPLSTVPGYDAQFGHFTYFGAPASGDRSRQEITLWQTMSSTLNGGVGSWDARGEGLGGWTLNLHHTYDPVAQTLYLGDGSQIGGQDTANGAGNSLIINTLAGDGTVGSGGDNGSGTQAQLDDPTGVAAGPDGTLYIADALNQRIRRVAPDGTISTVAGTGTAGFSGDNGPATQAELDDPTGVAVGPDGTLYIADTLNQRIRRVAPDGTISTVAGNGTFGTSGDNGPATQAQLHDPLAVAVGPDGTLYIADALNSRVRAVTPDGVISTIAGTGVAGYSGDGGPSEQAQIESPQALALDPNGNLYIADALANVVREVTPSGVITTVAGTGVAGYSGDQGPATRAHLNLPTGVAVGLDGSLYIADSGNQRIRRVTTDGTIVTLAGTGTFGFSGDAGLAGQAQIGNLLAVAIGPDGNLVLADAVNQRVRKVAPPLPGISLTDIAIPSADGNQFYIFDSSGRHLRTLDAMTGVTLFSFSYDSAGRLSSITDQDGQVTTIQHDANGNPTAIIAPLGQRTTLSVDANGYLSSVTDPDSRTSQYAYTSGGLLTAATDPRGHSYHFSYDSNGSLTQMVAPDGGITSLSRAASTGSTNAFTVTETSPMSRTTTYVVRDLPTGDQQRVGILPNGLSQTLDTSPDGTTTQTLPDGSVARYVQQPDVRFGTQSATLLTSTVSAPSGLSVATAFSQTVVLTNPLNLLSTTALSGTTTVDGNTSSSGYDSASRTETSISPTGLRHVTTLDSLGRVVQQSEGGLLPAQFSYDALGRVTTIVQGTRAFTYTYDSQGNLSTITDPLGRTQRFTYDAAGQILSKTLPDGGQMQFGYDANGNMTSIAPPGRSAYTATFDAMNRMQSMSPPAGGSITAPAQNTYNLDGQVTQITRHDGSTITMHYDGAGRLDRLTTPDGVTTFSFDPNTGNLQTVSEPNGNTMSYSFDGSLPTGINYSGPVTGTVGYTYTAGLLLAGETVDGGNTVSLAYNPNNQVTQVGALQLGYDPISGRVISSTLGSTSDALGYNGYGEPSSYLAQANSATLLSEQYDRNNIGSVTTQTETITSTTPSIYHYSYDLSGHLTGVTQGGNQVESYSYDANGNRTSATTTTPISGTVSVTATYNGQDQLVSYGPYTYQYNANGDLQSQSGPGGPTAYTYDSLGNLTGVSLPDGTQISYLVTGTGHRIARVAGGAVQGFLYGADGTNPVAELDSQGNVVSRFVYGVSNAETPAYMIKGGVTYRIISDGIGSPRLVVDAATGQVVESLAYDSFGNVITDTNPGFQPFGFAGGLYDRATHLLHFGVRDYDPLTGRWLEPDPERFGAGITNLYSYAQGDPINLKDSTGETPASTSDPNNPAWYDVSAQRDYSWQTWQSWVTNATGSPTAGWITGGLVASAWDLIPFTAAAEAGQDAGTRYGYGGTKNNIIATVDVALTVGAPFIAKGVPFTNSTTANVVSNFTRTTGEAATKLEIVMMADGTYRSVPVSALNDLTVLRPNTPLTNSDVLKNVGTMVPYVGLPDLGSKYGGNPVIGDPTIPCP